MSGKKKILQILMSLMLPVLIFSGVSACASASSTKDSVACSDCTRFVEEVTGIVGQLSEDERKVDIENFENSQKQAKVRFQVIKLMDRFLEGRVITDTGVMDAVIDVWLTVAEFESNSEVAESNFKHFKDHVSAINSRLDERIADAKSEDQKRLLGLIKVSLSGAVNADSGEAQDGP